MELKEIFGARLKNARVINGMSMDDLCTQMNNLVSKQTISKYESGKMLPNSTNLIALANALNVKPDYLLRPFTVSLDKIEFRKKSKMGMKEENSIKERIRDKPPMVPRFISLWAICFVMSLKASRKKAVLMNKAKYLLLLMGRSNKSCSKVKCGRKQYFVSQRMSVTHFLPARVVI